MRRDISGATLERLQSARARGHEVILVDGGSTDDTCAIAAGMVDQLLECVQGRAVQMNHGARCARGDIFIFLHADTWLHSEFDRILDARGVSEQGWGHFDIRLSGSHVMFRCIETLMNIRVRVTGIVTGDHTIFTGRHIFRQVNGYADIPLMEDVELTGRLNKFNFAHPYQADCYQFITPLGKARDCQDGTALMDVKVLLRTRLRPA